MIAHILIGLATVFMFEIFQSLRDLDMAQATLVHYVNISEPLPQIPNDTLTSSIRRRMNELYGNPELFVDSSMSDTTVDMAPEVLAFYQDYMKTYMNKLSHIQLFTDQESNLKLFTLNSRWIRAKPFTDFALHTLKEERLYQVNPKEPPRSQRKVWKHCFYQRLNGSVEAAAGNKEQDIIIAALHDAQSNNRSFMYFDRLKYNYSDSMRTSEFSELYFKAERRTQGIDSNIDYKDYQDLSSLEEDNNKNMNNLPEFNIYDIIPIDEETKIENIAVTENLIIYTTIEERMKLKYMFKTDQTTWTTKTLEYPITSVKFRIHKNLGMSFIFNAPTGEKQLLLVDLIANETDVQLIYHVFQFVQGNSLIQDEMLRYPYGVHSTDSIEPVKIYGTKSFELGRINIPQELATIDILKNFPRAIIRSNPATKQAVIASLNKYVFLISMEGQKEVFTKYQIRHFEDMESKIKDLAISEDGTYFSFLTYNKDREKVFIIQSKVAHAPPENKLYLVAFDHGIGKHHNTIKETRIINNKSNEPILLLLMEAGEVATFSLELGVMTWHGISGLLSGDDLDFFSLFSVAMVIIMFIIAKVASSTRISLNLQRLR